MCPCVEGVVEAATGAAAVAAAIAAVAAAAAEPLVLVPEELATSLTAAVRNPHTHVHHLNQRLTLVHFSAQLELICPTCNPSRLMNVSWSCSS